MEKTLKLIVETDKASRQDVEKAKQRREELTKELSVKKEEIEAQFKDKTDKALADAKTEAEKQLAEVSTEIDKICSEKAAVLNDTYNKNHEQWENDIFSAVTE